MGLALGCESTRPSGLRARSTRHEVNTNFHDEFLNDWSEPQSTASGPEPNAESGLRSFFRGDRLPGGLSSEARAIERESFNLQ